MNSTEAIRLLQDLTNGTASIEDSCLISVREIADVTITIQQLSTENEQLKAQLATAIVPRFKVGDTVFVTDIRGGVYNDKIAGVEVRYLSEVFYDDSEPEIEPMEYHEKQIFSSQQEAQASLNQKEG
jgi:hypothetical protein